MSDISVTDIKDKIYTIRGQQVMLDRDLAILYHVDTKRINEAVKRNKKRFPEKFCFQLHNEEMSILWSQNASANLSNKSRIMPHAFTEQGVSMLSAVLSSDYANEFHDRFLILDKKELYHIGASIKDAGKKGFAIMKDEENIILDSLIEGKVTKFEVHL